MSTKARMRRGYGRRRLTDQEWEALQTKKKESARVIVQNARKLDAFLSQEQPHPRKKGLLSEPIITRPNYADPIVEAFYQYALNKRWQSDFDPKAAWDAFIAPYVNRFGAPATKTLHKRSESRKRGGGRKDLSLFTKVFLEGLEESKQADEDDLALLRTRVWKKVKPSKPESFAAGKFQKDFLSRVQKYAPHLSPGRRGARGKSRGKSKR
jgi:hypothetical protein